MQGGRVPQRQSDWEKGYCSLREALLALQHLQTVLHAGGPIVGLLLPHWGQRLNKSEGFSRSLSRADRYCPLAKAVWREALLHRVTWSIGMKFHGTTQPFVLRIVEYAIAPSAWYFTYGSSTVRFLRNQSFSWVSFIRAKHIQRLTEMR